VDRLKGAILDDPVLHARLKGIGILTKEESINYSALGPTSRASGVAKDVRKDTNYGAYDRLDWEMIVTENGDVFDKAVVRLLELYESIKMVKQCLKDLPGGDIDLNIKNIPPGEGIGAHEAPRGETFHYVKSDGTNRPARHKVRAPTYMNLPTLKATVPGSSISDATIILAAIDPCYCCTERIAAKDVDGVKIHTGEELVALSREKTRSIQREMGLL
jgi:NADH-quinone oxidoreductase subunit D